MAKKTGGPSRSGFIRDYVSQNPKASFKEVAEAWAKLGNKDSIKTSLFYQVKNRKAGPKGKRGRPSGSKNKGALATQKVVHAASKSSFVEVEIMLDEVMAKAVPLRDSSLVEAVRTARRIASAKSLKS